MTLKSPHKFKGIAEYHRFRELPPPEHPLISLVNFDDIELKENEPERLIFNFYSIALRRHCDGVFKYGQQEYGYDKGVMLFMAPEQVFGIHTHNQEKPTGWLLMIHPDFLWNTPLAISIKQYDFFDYTANEALYLSPKEEECMIALLKIIQQEYHRDMDTYSHKIIIAQLELLLAYSERYYNRQFLTRRVEGHGVVSRLEVLLNEYFERASLADTGIPTVQQVAERLTISPKYLSGLLKNVTGQSTQQHIHNKLIMKAKEKLSTTDLSISEIAYDLGFEHPQSFNKFFKSKTAVTPLGFRQSFN